MAINWSLRVPYGYTTATRSLTEIKKILDAHYHPEYVRRLIPWLNSKGGHIGVGGHWRATGSQPDKSGFAPEGKSFHQDQRYADGFVGACAVDLVARRGGTLTHRSPFWSEVPAQGSKEAAKVGLHCNIGSEPWHMQPVEIDGWQSWFDAGRPFPRKDYPLPYDAPAPAPVPPAPTTPSEVIIVDAKVQVLRPNANAQRGYDVFVLQSILNGIYAAGLTLDGIYGLRSIAAVQDAQRKLGITVDGVVGPVTWSRLLNG